MVGQLRFESSHQYCYILLPCDRGSREESDTRASHMEVHMKESSINEFHHVEKIVPSDIYQCLLNVDRNQTVHVSTVKQWATCFCSGVSGSLLLVQILRSTAHRLLFVASENVKW